MMRLVAKSSRRLGSAGFFLAFHRALWDFSGRISWVGSGDGTCSAVGLGGNSDVGDTSASIECRFVACWNMSRIESIRQCSSTLIVEAPVYGELLICSVQVRVRVSGDA